MKDPNLYNSAVRVHCLVFLLLLGALPSQTAWGFRTTSITQQQPRRQQQQQQSNSIPGSTISTPRNRYRSQSPFPHSHSHSHSHSHPQPHQPLRYSSPRSDNDEQDQDTTKLSRDNNQNKESKNVVKNHKSNQTPLNIFTQLFQHFGYKSEDTEVETKTMAPPTKNKQKKETASRRAIVMPKQTTTSERVHEISIRKKPKASIQSNNNTSPQQHKVSSQTATNVAMNVTVNAIVFPTHDFQQRLLEESLAQRKNDTKLGTRLSTKYQESMKHIRILSELCNTTKRKDSTVVTSGSATFKKEKKGRLERDSAKKLVRKAAATGKILSKEEAKRSKAIAAKAANLTKTTRHSREEPKKVQANRTKATQSPKSNQIKLRPPLPPRQTPESKRSIRQLSKFQQRLLQSRLQSEARARAFVEECHEAIISEQKIQSQQKQYAFHRRLLEQQNTYHNNDAVELKQSLRVLEERLEQEERERQAKNKHDFLLHQSLLAAQYEYVETAKKFKMKLLLQEILQQKEEKRKQQQYEFQKHRLASSLQSATKQREKQKQEKLNSMLQDLNLINYTKKKIGEKSKFRFQRKLLEATIANERITRRQEKKKKAEQKKLKLQKGLMEQRLRSEGKADALKREAEVRAQFQHNLVEFYGHMASLSKNEQEFAADKMIRQKQKTDFQRELLSARIRSDLLSRKRLAEKRINELHQSLLDAQRESELAAAQVLEAEEQKRQAQLELEEQQKREEEEEAKRIEAEQRVQQQIRESKEREEAIRKDLENVGRQQSATDSDSTNGMNEYEAILEIQREEAMQRRVEEGKRRQDELQRMMENAGRTAASEQTMDRYEEILQQQKNEEIRRRQADAQRRQEALRRQLEEAGRLQAQEETATTMGQYSEWVEQANKTSLTRPDPRAPLHAATVQETAIPLQFDATALYGQSNSNLPAEQATTSDPAAASTSQEVSEAQQQQNQQDVDPLVGKVLLDKFVVAEKLRVGGDRSELYKCYHILDKPQEYALVIKLSHNIQQIELEHRIYGDLFSRLSQDRQELFVRAYDWVPASDLTNGRVGFAMECGLENLRGHIWRHGPYTGEKLRSAMENVIRIVQALHGLGVVWSELKAENFIVFTGDMIKAVDLESIAAHNEVLRAYTAETYPPEFPADSLYQCLPQIPVDYSFDVWGMGLTLYELAVGEPLFTLQRTYDVDYIKERLKNPQGIVDEANKKMWKVESGARNIIRKCLVVDPTKRSSCDELLQDPYFVNSKQSPPAAFSPSAMGTSALK